MVLSPYWKEEYGRLSSRLYLPPSYDGTPKLNNKTLLIHHVAENKTDFVLPYIPENCKSGDGKFNSLIIQLHPTPKDKLVINEWINTSTYIYNKTINLFNNGDTTSTDFDLRNKLVTYKTRLTHPDYDTLKKQINDAENEEEQKRLKTIQNKLPTTLNLNMKAFERRTKKEIRGNAVTDAFEARKVAFVNLKQKNITHFKMGYRKKKDKNKSIVIQKQSIKVNLEKKIISIYSLKLKIKYKKEFEINNDCRIFKVNSRYYISIPRPIVKAEVKEPVSWCGGDLGIKTLLTTYGSDGCYEYHFNMDKLNKLNTKIDALKDVHGIPKKAFYKIEKKKKDLVDEMHWKVVNDLTNRYDIIKMGNFKPKNIVERGNNHILNRNINDLKFFVLQKRLIYKASVKSKLVVQIDEHHTTKTCSRCGHTNDVGLSRVYECSKCNLRCGRDFNAAKNMTLKDD
jgi:putative transposase